MLFLTEDLRVYLLLGAKTYCICFIFRKIKLKALKYHCSINQIHLNNYDKTILGFCKKTCVPRILNNGHNRPEAKFSLLIAKPWWKITSVRPRKHSGSSSKIFDVGHDSM